MRLMKNVQRSPVSGRQRWQGHVDSAADGVVTGWALDKASPAVAVDVAAVAGSGKTVVARADGYREDLETAGFGDGRHGFTLDLSSWGPDDGTIEVQIVGADHVLEAGSLEASEIAVKPEIAAPVSDETARWRGWIDSFDRNFVRGWAADTDNLFHRVRVEAVSRTGKRITGLADQFRGDLKDAGLGDGCHAFEIDLRAWTQADCPIDVNVDRGRVRINRQPLDFDMMTMAATIEAPPAFRAIVEAAAQEVLDAGGIEVPDPSADDEGAAAAPRGASAPSPASRTLLETAQPAADPEGLVSKFMRYEAFRCEREKYESAMTGALQDRLKVAMWYLVKYLRDRQYRYLLPLSATQQRFLNGPVPLADYPPEVTVALFNFVRAERPELSDLDDPAVLRKALYWWCCERTPRDRLDGGLVTKAMATALTREEQWVGQGFPFSVFMAEYFSAHPELHVLDMRSAPHRALFVVYLVVKSFTEPFIARFLPRDVLRLMLQTKDGAVRLDTVIGHLAGGAGIDGATVRRKGEALLASHGISLRRLPTFEPRDLGEGLIRRRDLSGPLEPGVALIGPLHKTSGLGQATRLSYDALKLCEATAPTTLPFDLDNPAPVGFGSVTDSETFDRPRAINLLHLNAESVPLAFTFEQQEIFSRSYNIGYFFWELNVIPKCHHLALELLDEVWVSSEYNREIYSRYTDKPVVNVGMAVEALPRVEPMDRAVFGLDAGATVFLSTFDSFSFIERKNPMGVLDAFRLAFPRGDEPVQLVLKTQNRGRVYDAYQIDLWQRIDRAVSVDPRIIVLNETLPYRDVLALKLACDCYVSLHRSEGWGFGMLEAMNLGRPVIATAYSGNMDFCTPETTYLVDHDMIGVREAEYIFVERGSVWAQPRLADAAARMREVAADPAAARARGAAAKAHVEANFSTAAIARRYGARLAQIRAMRG